MNNPGLFQARWNLRRLALCNFLPLALLAFWLWPTGQMLCVIFDEWLFHRLNAPLASHPIWLHSWAIASLRPFDTVVGVILLALTIKGDWVFERVEVRQAFLGFLSILLVLVCIRLLFSTLVGYMDWQHNSPSMMIKGAVRMSDYFPDLENRWELKDRSTQSFPADHASVLLIWALFMTVFSRNSWQTLLIWSLTLLFMMPRLVAGANWGQDDYIGGLLLAVWVLGWGYYTPFAYHASAFFLKVTAPAFGLLEKLPVVSRMSVVRGA